MESVNKYCRGGHEVNDINILRLISELEGSSQLLKYMDFAEDEETINEIKGRYYKLYFKLKRDSKASN
jgi:hypothetical protein